MNGNFEDMLSEVSQINEDIKKCWRTETSGVYTSSLDDALVYMKKIIERCEDILPCPENITDEDTLSGFSFD